MNCRDRLIWIHIVSQGKPFAPTPNFVAPGRTNRTGLKRNLGSIIHNVPFCLPLRQCVIARLVPTFAIGKTRLPFPRILLLASKFKRNILHNHNQANACSAPVQPLIRATEIVDQRELGAALRHRPATHCRACMRVFLVQVKRASRASLGHFSCANSSPSHGGTLRSDRVYPTL